MARFSPEAVDTFRSTIRGEIVLPQDSNFDQARTIWNAMIDCRPAIIVRCSGVTDIMRSIEFARANELVIAVRGGGHNIAGSALCDDGLVIDLSQLRNVRVDPEKRRAWVSPGATLGDLDHATQAFGLATPSGINSTTGVAGLTLGGGFGWLTRKHGMTVDNLRSADVVTASGQLLRASADENEDLFWAIRGGGGNFGIVTSFEFELHPVGPEVTAGLIVFPGEQALQVLEHYRSLTSNLPEEANVWVVMRKAPPLPFLPEDVHGKDVVVLAVFHIGKSEDAEKLFAPIRGFGNPYGEHVGPVPYAAWQQAFDPLLTPGARNYWKSHNFTELSGGALKVIVENAGKLPTGQTEIFIGLLGAKASRVPVEATAYSSREAKYVMNVHGRWDAPEEDQKVIGWARDFFSATTEFASGSVYINFLTSDEQERIAAAYGPNFDRLARIKAKYDPDNIFRTNQNIRPA